MKNHESRQAGHSERSIRYGTAALLIELVGAVVLVLPAPLFSLIGFTVAVTLGILGLRSPRHAIATVALVLGSTGILASIIFISVWGILWEASIGNILFLFVGFPVIMYLAWAVIRGFFAIAAGGVIVFVAAPALLLWAILRWVFQALRRLVMLRGGSGTNTDCNQDSWDS